MELPYSYYLTSGCQILVGEETLSIDFNRG